MLLVVREVVGDGVRDEPPDRGAIASDERVEEPRVEYG
jgi:hypothetical protein